MDMEKRKLKIPEYIKQIFVCLSLIVLILMGNYLYQNYFFKEFTVVGEEMAPLLNNGDVVRISLYKNETLKRGQLVAMQARDGTEDIWVRRVIALPGDTVQCIDNVLYVNGEPVDESYLDEWFVERTIEEYGYFTNDFNQVYVEEGYFFYLGDNRIESDPKDARSLGYAAEESIIGVDLTLIQENKALE